MVDTTYRACPRFVTYSGGDEMDADTDESPTFHPRVLQGTRSEVDPVAARMRRVLPDQRPEAQAPPSGPVRWVRAGEVADHLRGRDYRWVDRVLASFGDRDTIFLSGLPPVVFRRPGASAFRAPHLLLHVTEPDEWIAVDDVQVGYGGYGPTQTRHVLVDELRLIDSELVDAIAYSRVSIVDPNASPADWFHTDDWPYVKVPSLTVDPSGYAISTTEVDHVPPGDGGFAAAAAWRARRVPSANEMNPPSGLHRWIELLDGRLPSKVAFPQWLKGERRARVFLDRQEAIRQGFQWRGENHSSPTVIIEQGDLQIWLRTPSPDNESQWLSDQAHRALMLANVAGSRASGARLLERMAAHDAQNIVLRWVHSRIELRPLVVDIGGPLQHDPLERPYVKRARRAWGYQIWNP